MKKMANDKDSILKSLEAGGGGAADLAMEQATRNTEMMRAFKLTGEAKLRAVVAYINDLLLAEGLKFLVFAHHQAVMDGICDGLKLEKGASYVRIDGNTPQSTLPWFSL